MNLLANILAIALLACWSILGIIFYTSISDHIENPQKKMIARIVAGPAVWFCVTLGYALDSACWLDDAYVSFCNWLKKP